MSCVRLMSICLALVIGGLVAGAPLPRIASFFSASNSRAGKGHSRDQIGGKKAHPRFPAAPTDNTRPFTRR
jgi:hypothetical protein